MPNSNIIMFLFPAFPRRLALDRGASPALDRVTILLRKRQVQGFFTVGIPPRDRHFWPQGPLGPGPSTSDPFLSVFKCPHANFVTHMAGLRRKYRTNSPRSFLFHGWILARYCVSLNPTSNAWQTFCHFLRFFDPQFDCCFCTAVIFSTIGFLLEK